jgi:ATP-binding cassette subfamily B protein
VLRDLDFSVRPGEHVAIVGSTGAGKTSTIALLLRFYEHQQGTLRVGGHSITDLSTHALRSLFSVVSQDVFLFRGTVGQNLAMGAEVDAERATVALRRVGALEMVEARGGLSAAIDERGQNFSAGQRQLLAFARALYRDAPILVLDEATANIDSETEAAVQKAVGELIAGRTAIVIAHRLSTIRHADRIVVFHRGRIVEQGTHEELLERGQVYAHLHRLQFAVQ